MVIYVRVITVKLPEKLIHALDRLVNKSQIYSSRSEAIRHAIILFLKMHGYNVKNIESEIEADTVL